MYANVFNLTNFISEAFLYFKETNEFDLASLILFCISLLFYLGTSIKSAKDPSLFGCFFSSFK